MSFGSWAACLLAQSVSGHPLLVDITGTGLLARAALPVNSPFTEAVTREEEHHGILQGKLGPTSGELEPMCQSGGNGGSSIAWTREEMIAQVMSVFQPAPFV